jgi:hypothetical protein
MRDIEGLQVDIRRYFRQAGLPVGANGFERIDRSSAYVYSTFENLEAVELGRFAEMVLALEGTVLGNQTPIDIKVVCHTAGSFSFLVSIE